MNADILINEFGIVSIVHPHHIKTEILLEDPFGCMAELGMLGPIQYGGEDDAIEG